MAQGTIKENNNISTSASIKYLDFIVSGNRLVITAYTNYNKTEGLRFDIDGTNARIELDTYANNVFTAINRMAFPHL